MAADANPKSSDTIDPARGHIQLTIPPPVTTGRSGDLDILVDNKLTIKGSTKGGQTIINGNNLDRVFLTLSGKVAMSNLVIEHGSVLGQGIAQGGGLWNDGATVTLTSVQFLDDFAVGQTGAMAPLAQLTGMWDGRPARRRGGLAEGGAICNFGPSLTLTNCFLNGNEAIGGDGGHGGDGGSGGGANGRSTMATALRATAALEEPAAPGRGRRGRRLQRTKRDSDPLRRYVLQERGSWRKRR